MNSKPPNENLPAGWRMGLEMSNSGGAIVVAEAPNAMKAIGKEDIERLVHQECKRLEDRQIIIRHLKWSLERVERLQTSTQPKLSSSSKSAPTSRISGNRLKRPRSTEKKSSEDEISPPENMTQSCEVKDCNQNQNHAELLIWSLDPALDHLRRVEYLNWLKLLQLNQNILCYGIGSKYSIIHNFATIMLRDEDVIELKSKCFEEDPSSSSSTTTPTSSSSAFLHAPTPTQRKKSGEEVLWNLFQLIRKELLSSSRIPSSSIWSLRSDGTTYPLLTEARIISDFLCLHYNYHKTGMGKRFSIRKDMIRELICQQPNSVSPLVRAFSNEYHHLDVEEVEDDVSEISCISNQIDDPSSLWSMKSRSRETANLLSSHLPSSSMNWDYVNSFSRLYLILHNIEDIFHTSSNTQSPSLYKAFCILAECPVVSIIASITSLNSPLYAGWDLSHLHSLQWSYKHTPSSIPHDPLPEVVIAMSNESRKNHSDRADTLKYILKSLTKKHHEIIKFLLNISTNPADNSSDNSAPQISATNRPLPPQSQTQAQAQSQGQSQSGGSGGVGWFTLLSHAMTHFIAKGDSELRQLVSELKDQRIVRTYSDRDSKVYVTLMLSGVERTSALDYYQADKKEKGEKSKKKKS